MPSVSGFQDMVVEEDDGVLTVTLNCPEKLNALTVPMRVGLKKLPSLITERDSIKAVVITGAGRGFCSGADMSRDAPNPYADPARRGEARYQWISEFQSVSKPVIAAINGPAAGGGLAIALACDIRIAAESALLTAVWIRRGLVPDMGASQLLVRQLGPSRALRMIWSGESVPSRAALEIGLVDQVVEDDELLTTAQDYARKLAKGPSLAIELSKRLVYFGIEHGLVETSNLEDLYQRMAATSSDAIAARNAFQTRNQ
jgi:2-(1,2-epoxy-1,2-dihydrophenyl)acetyl-CoA isomerase